MFPTQPTTSYTLCTSAIFEKKQGGGWVLDREFGRILLIFVTYVGPVNYVDCRGIFEDSDPDHTIRTMFHHLFLMRNGNAMVLPRNKPDEHHLSIELWPLVGKKLRQTFVFADHLPRGASVHGEGSHALREKNCLNFVVLLARRVREVTEQQRISMLEWDRAIIDMVLSEDFVSLPYHDTKRIILRA